MPDILEELKRKRRTIEQFQRDQAKQEGQEEQLLKQLKDECDATSVKKAEEVREHLSEEKAESEKLLTDLDAQMGEIIHNARPGSNSGSV